MLRWGDYSGMALDPNGCEFWETGEYYATTGLNHQTRIGSFHFPGCTTVGNGTLSGTVTDGGNPISGATVTLGSRTATTNASGAYSFTVPAGTYPTETAAKPGFNPASAATLVVPDGGTLTKNFALTAAAQSGCFTDNTQSTFQRGVPNGCDLNANPGSVQLKQNVAINQTNTTVTNSGFGFNSTSWAGQTFTPSATGQVTQVDLDLFCSGCTGTTPNLTVSIRATTGATPVPTGRRPRHGDDPRLQQRLRRILLRDVREPADADCRNALRHRLPPGLEPLGRHVRLRLQLRRHRHGQLEPVRQRPARDIGDQRRRPWAADTTVGGRDLGFNVWMNRASRPPARSSRR